MPPDGACADATIDADYHLPVRSVATFLSLMTAGVLIVLVYIWSGESIIALAFSIVTLFAVLALLQWQPWVIDDDNGGGRAVDPPQVLGQKPSASRAASMATPTWRCPFDITWDERGISGVAMGSRAPQMWSWSQIDDIGHDWYRSEVGAGPATSPTDAGAGRSSQPEERVAFRLDFPDLRNPEEPAQAWVRFGPQQDPEDVERLAKAEWRGSKVKRSRFFELTPKERTMKLADHLAPQNLGPDRLDLTDWPRSPELLYQEVRRELLAGGELCRLAPDSTFEEVLDSFDVMFEANGVGLITTSEADELLRFDGPSRVASLHRTLDWVAEQRGLRVAFIDQSTTRGGDDYLIGLIPAASADDWDGQTVGSGTTRIMLDRPN